MKKEIAGIDVSKLTLDVWLHHAQTHCSFKNNEKGFGELLSWVSKQTAIKPDDIAFVFEHTGLYSLPLSMFLTTRSICFYMVSGLRVKRSLGLVRGKNDKTDARNLARFAFMHASELSPYQLPSEHIVRLRMLLSSRSRLVRQSAAHKAYLKECTQILKLDSNDVIVVTEKELITILNSKIKDIECQMLCLIKGDPELETTYKLIRGIKGVGPVLAATMICATNNFASFKSWRQFASYAGIAPFEHQSGTSYRGKTKVSSLGHRGLKTLLNLAACTAIQYSAEMKAYYQRRLQEGKAKMSTINIIRNKLLSRIFAVAKRQTPFADTFKFAA